MICNQNDPKGHQITKKGNMDYEFVFMLPFLQREDSY